MLSLIVVLAALLLLWFVLQDSFEVMLLPRRVYRRVRLARLFFRTTWAVWVRLSHLLPESERRIRFLGVFGPLSMVVLFALWATMLVIGFGLIDWDLQGHGSAHSSLPEQIYLSGVTFFTLGYGDVVPHAAITRGASVIEAGTGLGFIAVVIGYLPILYQVFAKREAHVIQLDARAGSPPSAVTMLSLHAGPDSLGKLDELLREWEVWGAELLESHLSYPMLVYYRSQRDNQSWLAALAAVMDTCTLILVGVEDLPPLQARMTFTMTRQVIVEVARAISVNPSRFTGGNRLPHEDYLEMERRFAEVGLVWNGGPDAEETLHALRATYEPLLDGLAARLILPLPAWLAPEGSADHWQTGHRGLIASRLVTQLAGHGGAGVTVETRAGGMAQRLRKRLRRT